jgi:hypothetical protein
VLDALLLLDPAAHGKLDPGGDDKALGLECEGTKCSNASIAYHPCLLGRHTWEARGLRRDNLATLLANGPSGP